MRRDRRGQRLIALAILAALLFNYPLLSIFDRPDTVAGIPFLYAYLFVAWGGLIALLALIAERGR